MISNCTADTPLGSAEHALIRDINFYSENLIPVRLEIIKTQSYSQFQTKTIALSYLVLCSPKSAKDSGNIHGR